MSIKGKFFIIIFAVILSFIVSIGVYFFIQRFIKDVENEKNIIIDLRIACIKSQVEINRLHNANLMNQIIIYKESKFLTNMAFENLEKIIILPRINESIEIAVEKISNLKNIINNLDNALVEDLDLVVADAKNVFQEIANFKIDHFFNNEIFLNYPNTKLVHNNINKLISDIEIINENLNSSISIINSQFEVINEEIEKLRFRSNIISIAIVLLLLIICVVFSSMISNKILQSIKKIEKAIEKVAKGDFTTKLDIKTNDEFRFLSDNYNIFIKDLKGKIESELDFMKNVSSSITSNMNFSKILDLITEYALKDTNAEGAAAFLFEDDGECLVEDVIKGKFPPVFYLPDTHTYNRLNMNIGNIDDKLKKIKFNETIFSDIIKTKQPIFIKNNTVEKRLQNIYGVDTSLINSFIAFPLTLSNNIIGFLAITTSGNNNFLTDLDYTHLNTFAEYASLTLQNWKSYLEVIEKREIERDIKIAAEIQKRLVPDKFVGMDKLDVSVYSAPAKGVGGDYYDIIKLDNNKVAVVVCDVSGKGISAALLMVMIRTILHLVVSANRDISTILSWINKGIIGSIGVEYYATFSMLIFDNETKEVIYSNAAHSPLLVYKKALNKIFQIDTAGIPLGIEKGTRYPQKKFKLDDGDFLVLYTDGITEAMDQNKNQYRLDTLKQMLLKSSDLSSKEILNQVINDIKRHTLNSKQFDDQTLLMLKIKC